jgi:hypothetical protein
MGFTNRRINAGSTSKRSKLVGRWIAALPSRPVHNTVQVYRSTRNTRLMRLHSNAHPCALPLMMEGCSAIPLRSAVAVLKLFWAEYSTGNFQSASRYAVRYSLPLTWSQQAQNFQRSWRCYPHCFNSIPHFPFQCKSFFTFFYLSLGLTRAGPVPRVSSKKFPQ